MASIHAGTSVLPANRTPWELALSLTSAEHRDIDADAIRRAFDPWTCPAPLLPWLAHAFSVDFWRDEWSESKKRRVIARSIPLQFIKGTEQAVREFAELADSRILRVTVPPQRVFCGPSLDKAAREAWLSALPQVRVWNIRDQGTRGRAIYTGGDALKSFIEGRFLLPSTAKTRMKRRARWVVGGLETDVTVAEFEGYFRLHLKGAEGLRVFSGQKAARRFFQPSTARERLVTIQPSFDMPWRAPVGPRLEPVTVEPEIVKVPAPRGKRAFMDAGTARAYLAPHEPRSFQRYAIFDGSRMPKSSPVQFMNVGRLGWPAHTAMLAISIPGKRSPYQAGEGVHAPKTRFYLPHDGERVAQVRRALRASMRHSDRLLLDFKGRPRVLAGQLFRAGIDSFVIGRPAA